MEKKPRKTKEFRQGILITVIGGLISAFLLALFTNVFSFLAPGFTVINYYLFLIFNRYIFITLTFLGIIALTALALYKQLNRNKKIFYVFLLLIALVSTYIVHQQIAYLHGNSCDPNQIFTVSFIQPLTLTSSGSFTSNTEIDQNINQGIYDALLSTPLKSSSYVLSQPPTIDFTDTSESIPPLTLIQTSIPPSVLRYYGLQKKPIDNFILQDSNCLGMANLVETDSTGLITYLNPVVRFPLFFPDSNIYAYFDVQNRINRLVKLGVLSPHDEGFYIGAVDKAMLEQFFVPAYTEKQNYDVALALMQNSQNEFTLLDQHLQNVGQGIGDPNIKKQFLAYINDDAGTWNAYVDGQMAEIYSQENNYPLAEEYLKSMFDNRLYVNDITYQSFLQSFEAQYFTQASSLPKEQVLKLLESTGLTGVLDVSTYNEDKLDQSLGYFVESSTTTNFNTFFSWLANKYPNDPTPYMYWGKLYTIQGEYLLGAAKYKQALAIDSNSVMLNILYQTALFNNVYQNTTDINKVKAAADAYYTALGPLLNSPELLNYLLPWGEASTTTASST